jgi:putative copper resistance protein D
LRAAPAAGALVDRQVRVAAWIGLAAAVASGLAWVLLLTMSLSDEGVFEAATSGALRDVLNLTQFGLVSQVRLGIAIVLAICLVFERSVLWRRLGLAAAVCLAGSIAWTGHAASTPFALGYLHLASDVLHLIAASAWIGGLLPLVLLLGANRCEPGCAAAELDAVQRFSVLGMVSVATLIVSGIVNAWILVGSFGGLVVNGYGLLLMLKLAAFAVMLAFAALNRFALTPRLALPSGDAQQDARRTLSRNTWIEIALGLSIFAMVGVLGTLHPAAHLMQ